MSEIASEIVLLTIEDISEGKLSEVMLMLDMIYGSDKVHKKKVDRAKLSNLKPEPDVVLVFWLREVDDDLSIGLSKHAIRHATLIVYEGVDQLDIYRIIRSNVRGIISSNLWHEIPKAIEEIHNYKHYACQNILQTFVDKNPSPRQISLLTGRQMDVIHLMAKGLTYHEISDELNISYDTTKTHIYNICKKLGAKNKTEAVHKARLSMILT